MSYTLSQLIRRNIIGKCETILHHSNTAMLTNIHIQEPYRRYRYGSVLLNDTETFLAREHRVKCIELFFWKRLNAEECPSRFFESNDYLCHNNMLHKHVHDDGEYLYELYKYSKELNPRQNKDARDAPVNTDDIFHQTL